MAVGADTVSNGIRTTAFGYGAVASGVQSTAAGAGSNAQGVGALAFGAFSHARDDRATALGYSSLASSVQSTAIGAEAQARGENATAIGYVALARADNATAIGTGATADFVGSTAIGAGATTTAANQIAIGTATDTVEVASLNNGSGQQSGTIYLVTADESGTLGRTAFNPDAILGTAQRGFNVPVSAVTDAQFDALSAEVAAVTGRVGTLEGQFADLSFQLEDLDQRMSGGIAQAMAMGNAPIIPGKSVSVWVNAATYNGEQGFAGSFAGRVSESVYLSAGFGTNTGDDEWGGRVGIGFGF
ncbi:MAG: hypothetical protein CL808_03785 [Citromicrobium sp.]|nr:hypothetical protein [Citromicrobium sp.]